MKRSNINSKANNTKNPLDIMNYKKQHKYMTKLNKILKLEYFNNLKLVKDNKPFCETNANLILLISTVKPKLILS